MSREDFVSVPEIDEHVRKSWESNFPNVQPALTATFKKLLFNLSATLINILQLFRNLVGTYNVKNIKKVTYEL